jgi:hypothetical protein
MYFASATHDLTTPSTAGGDAATGFTGFWYRVLLHGKNNGAASAVHGAAADQHNVHLRTPKHEGQNESLESSNDRIDS